MRRTLAETGERPGNEGRNIVRGPGFNRTDLSLFKNVALFRKATPSSSGVEAFNLFNQVRFGQPSRHHRDRDVRHDHSARMTDASSSSA